MDFLCSRGFADDELLQFLRNADERAMIQREFEHDVQQAHGI